MTDKDRYGKSLGKAFRAVRGRLCSVDDEGEAVNRYAAYIHKEFLKELPEIAKYLKRFQKAIERPDGLFERESVHADIALVVPNNVAGDDFKRALRRANGSVGAAIDHLAQLGVEATERCAKLQDGYKNDRECLDAMASRREETYQKLKTLFAQTCGLEKKPHRPKKIRKPTTDMVNVVLVRNPKK